MSKLVVLKRLLSTPVTDGPHETPEFHGSGVPFMSAESVKNGYLDFSLKRGYISVEQHNEYIRKANPQRGDVFMVKSGATTGKVAIVETDDKFSIWSPLALMRANKKLLNPRYLYYSLKSDFFQEQVENSWSFGTQQNIGMQVIENLNIYQPSIEAQEKQVKILDEKTAIVAEMITAKYRTRAQLSEFRTAIITNDVLGKTTSTGVQNTNTPWVGAIPAHWKIEKIKGVSDIVLGKMLQPTEKDGYVYKKYLRAQNVRWETVNVKDVNEMWFSPTELVSFRLEKGDLLVTEGGEVGRTAMWHGELEECYIQNSVNRLRAKKNKVLPEFLLFVLESYGKAKVFENTVNRVSIAHLTREKLKEYIIPLPPLDEQRQIVDDIQRRLEKIDAADAALQKSVAQLEEYRSSLISNVITGKVAI